MVCHKTYQDPEKNWVYPEDVIRENTGEYVYREKEERL